MDYGAFHAAYGKVQDDISAARLRPTDLKDEILRLEGMLDAIGEPAARWQADADLDQLRDLLRMAETLPAPPVSQAQLEAIGIAQEASDSSGSQAQQVRRLRRGMSKIHKLAARIDDPSEQNAVRRQAEPLEMRASALERPDGELER